MPIKHKKSIPNRLVNLTLPTRHNSYKPWLSTTPVLIAVAVMLVLAHVVSNSLLKQELSFNGSGNYSEENMLTSVNSERRALKTNGLKLDSRLTKAAEKKVDHMFVNQYWAHTSPDNIEAWSFIKAENYLYEESAENLAKGFSNPEGVVAGWRASKSHYESMVNPAYTNVGFASKSGKLNGHRTTLHVALFAKPLSGATIVDADEGKKALSLQGGAAEYLGNSNTVNFSLINPLDPESTLNEVGKISLAVLVVLLALYLFQHYHLSRTKLYKPKQVHENTLLKIAFIIFAICLVVATSYGSVG